MSKLEVLFAALVGGFAGVGIVTVLESFVGVGYAWLVCAAVGWGIANTWLERIVDE